MTTRITENMLVNTLTFVTRFYGAGKWNDVLEKMEDGTRQIFRGKLSASGWRDFAVIADLLEALEEILSPSEENVMHKLGLHNAEADLRVTQKLIMRILTIKLVLKIASFLWTGRVKNGGRLVVISTARTAVKCRIEDPPDVSPQWWKYLAGWFQRTIELAGGKNVRASWTGGGSEKGETAEFEVSW